MKSSPLPSSALVAISSPSTVASFAISEVPMSRYRQAVRVSMAMCGAAVQITMAITVMSVPIILRIPVMMMHVDWCAVAVVDHWRRSYNDRSVMVMIMPQRNAEAHTCTRLRRGRKHRHYDCTQEY